MDLKLICLAAAISAYADSKDHFKTGNELLSHGDATGAALEFQAALADKPEHPAILDGLGRAEFHKGNYRTAKRYYERALQIGGPGKALTLTNASMTAIALGEFRRAEAYLRQAVELAPTNHELRIRLAQCLLRNDQHREAKAILLDLGSAEKNPVALAALAEVYIKEKRREEALQAMQTALALSARGPVRTMLLCNIGSLQWDLGNRETSVDTLQKAVAEAEIVFGTSHPDTALILEEFGWILRKLGRKAEAGRAVERAESIRLKFAGQTNPRNLQVDWTELTAKQ